ncbi:MAG: DUF1376 domain-containing protein [Geminicoccaceae bacterium]
MAELPAHPMFWSDFFADTEHMSEGAAKAYLFIIGHSWIRGGKVKNDDRLLARLCRLSLKRWKAIKDEVMEMLEVDEEGNVYQRRVQKDYVDVRRRAIVNSKNGAKGGKAKAAKKSNENNDSDVANATNSPERNESETLASITKTKESTGKGLERRRLRPGGQDPPPTKPDPEKFVMTAEWVMPSGLHDELTAEYVPKLGVEPFWRQIERFAKHHAELGTVDTEAGFAALLLGWLERAMANREKLPPASTGADPPNPASKDIVPSMGTDDFRDRVAKLYDDALADSGKKRMKLVEAARIKTNAGHMKIGKTSAVGLARGPTWTVADVLRALGLTKSEAA